MERMTATTTTLPTTRPRTRPPPHLLIRGVLCRKCSRLGVIARSTIPLVEGKAAAAATEKVEWGSRMKEGNVCGTPSTICELDWEPLFTMTILWIHPIPHAFTTKISRATRKCVVLGGGSRVSFWGYTSIGLTKIKIRGCQRPREKILWKIRVLKDFSSISFDIWIIFSLKFSIFPLSLIFPTIFKKFIFWSLV